MHLLSSRPWRAAAAGAAALALVLTGCSAEPTVTYTPPPQADGSLPGDMVEQMQAAVDDAMAAAGASGAIVGVWVPWSGQWVTAVGTQSVDDQTPVKTDMAFRIGDVTRLMTCDVLYGLAADGELELDAPVPDYVSGVPDLEDVTLLDLCNGTSGIGSSEGNVKSAWLNTPAREWAPLELASFGLSHASGASHTTWKNSDAGYLLLGLALQRASGMSAAELIDQYVAVPFGLEHTSLPAPTAAAPGSSALRGNYAPAVKGGYDCTAPVDITVASSSMGFTDSGVVSTIEDLGRYARAEAARAAGDDSDRFAAPLPVSSDSPNWYQATGGGFLVGTMVGGHGWTPGYSTAAYADPETGFTVAVTLNNSSAGSSIVAHLSWELAAIASKAPAASGETAPAFGLPFTAEEYHAAKKDSICVAPPKE